MPTYRQDPKTGEFIEASDWEVIYGKPEVHFHQIMPDIAAFVSPIDNTVISSRPQLRDHNDRHGVTNIADYSQSYFEKSGKQLVKQARGQTAKDKQERCKALDKTLTDFGV